MAATGTNAVELKALTDKHRQVAALLAQGVGRSEIATIIDFTPEYVTWLARDPLFKKYMEEMAEFAQLQAEAMFSKSIEAISEGLDNTNKVEDRLKAARLQLELTGRVGRVERSAATSEDSVNRLVRLQERLLSLLPKQGHIPEVIDVQVEGNRA